MMIVWCSTDMTLFWFFTVFFVGNACIERITKGVADAHIPPDTMNTAAPDGAPPRRF